MPLNRKLLRDLLLAMNDVYDDDDNVRREYDVESESNNYRHMTKKRSPTHMPFESFKDTFTNMDTYDKTELNKEHRKAYDSINDVLEKFSDNPYGNYRHRPNRINGGIPACIRARMEMGDSNVMDANDKGWVKIGDIENEEKPSENKTGEETNDQINSHIVYDEKVTAIVDELPELPEL